MTTYEIDYKQQAAHRHHRRHRPQWRRQCRCYSCWRLWRRLLCATGDCGRYESWTTRCERRSWADDRRCAVGAPRWHGARGCCPSSPSGLSGCSWRDAAETLLGCERRKSGLEPTTAHTRERPPSVKSRSGY